MTQWINGRGHYGLTRSEAEAMARGDKTLIPPKQRSGLIRLLDIEGVVIDEAVQDLDLFIRDVQAAVDAEQTPVNVVCEQHKYNRWFVPGCPRSLPPQFGKQAAKAFIDRETP